MEEKLRDYIENVFSTVPYSVKAVELKEEILQNLLDKYHDLLNEGKSEQAAYNISVASIGDINELLGAVNPQNNPANNEQLKEVVMKTKQRNAILTAVAIALYILSPVPCIIAGNSVVGPVLLFVFVAIATGLLIYKSMTKATYLKTDETLVEEFKEWSQNDSEKKSLYKAISSALWAVLLVVYFAISFSTGAWAVTWLVFPIGGALEGVIKAILDLKNVGGK